MYNEFEKDEFMLDDDGIDSPKKKSVWDEDEDPAEDEFDTESDEDEDSDPLADDEEEL